MSKLVIIKFTENFRRTESILEFFPGLVMTANFNAVLFILHLTSADVNKSGGGFHQLQLPLPNQFVCLWC